MSKRIYCVALAASCAASMALAGAPTRQKQVPSTELKWQKPFGPNGPELANVSGDPKKGPYSFFFRFHAGYDSGWHTHDADYTAVVLAGTMENIEQGGETDARPLPAGSVWTQPAGRNHITRCTAGECLVFVSSRDGTSFHPMSAEGKSLK